MRGVLIQTARIRLVHQTTSTLTVKGVIYSFRFKRVPPYPAFMATIEHNSRPSLLGRELVRRAIEKEGFVRRHCRRL